MKTYIYYLEREGIPFYIGKTNKPSNRQNSHRAKRKDFTIHLHTIDLVDSNNWKYWETFYISLFKSWGFVLENKNKGGGGTDVQSMFTKLLKSSKLKGKLKPPRTKEHCLKLSQSTKGHLVSEITKNKISQSNKGRKSPMEGKIGPNKGKIMGDEQKLKISKSNKGKPKPQNFLLERKKQVLCLNTNQIYESISEAAKQLNLPISGVSQCCRSKRKYTKGYEFKFKN
jgi:hypothetical protein